MVPRISACAKGRLQRLVLHTVAHDGRALTETELQASGPRRLLFLVQGCRQRIIVSSFAAGAADEEGARPAATAAVCWCCPASSTPGTTRYRCRTGDSLPAIPPIRLPSI